MTDSRPVAARGLVKRYGDLVAVDHVDLTVEKGDVFGYLGPNGAGKTTSLRMLLGLIRPTEGSAQLFGRDPLEDGAKALDGVAGFVEGPRFYPYLSGMRNLKLLSDYDEPVSRSRIEEVLELVELRDREAVADALERLDLVWARERRVDTLSGGEHRRVLLARALAQA